MKALGRGHESAPSRTGSRAQLVAAAALVMAAVLVPTTLTAASEADDSPGPAYPTVVADGPFGRVSGMPGTAVALPSSSA